MYTASRSGVQSQANLRRLQHLFQCECDILRKGMKAATCWCSNLQAAWPGLANEAFPQHYASAVSRAHMDSQNEAHLLSICVLTVVTTDKQPLLPRSVVQAVKVVDVAYWRPKVGLQDCAHRLQPIHYQCIMQGACFSHIQVTENTLRQHSTPAILSLHASSLRPTLMDWQSY